MRLKTESEKGWDTLQEDLPKIRKKLEHLMPVLLFFGSAEEARDFLEMVKRNQPGLTEVPYDSI